MGKRERFKLDCSMFVLLFKDRKFCFLQRTGTGWKDGFYSVPAGALEPERRWSVPPFWKLEKKLA